MNRLNLFSKVLLPVIFLAVAGCGGKSGSTKQTIVDYFRAYSEWRQENPVKDHYGNDLLLRDAFSMVCENGKPEGENGKKTVDVANGYIRYENSDRVHFVECKRWHVEDGQKVLLAVNCVTGNPAVHTSHIDFALFDTELGEMKYVHPWDMVAPLGVDNWVAQYQTNDARTVLFSLQREGEKILFEIEETAYDVVNKRNVTEKGGFDLTLEGLTFWGPHGFDAMAEEFADVCVARVAEFPSDAAVDEFIKNRGFSDNYLKTFAMEGETAFLIAPEHPNFIVSLYHADDSDLGYDWENPIASAGAGQVLVFFHTVPEGIPSVVVVVNSNSDGGESTLWQWSPQRSGMDNSLIMNEKFVKF
jgi:hypothetical protein